MTQDFLPNEADAFHDNQAEPDSVDFEILLLGYEGTGVVSGCAVTESSPAAQTVDVAAGTVLLDGNQVTVALQEDEAVSAADGSNPRFDLITINSSGTVVVTAGTAAAQPVLPAVPATSIPLAALYIPISDNTHADEQIVDKRVIIGPSTPDVDTRYITTGGSDSDDGLTWETAMATVAFAVDSLPTAGSGGTLRHTGRIEVGAGTFDETVTIEWNASLEIKGAGTDSDGAGNSQGGTVIRRNHSGDLFAVDGGYTTFGHHLRMSNLVLHGNKASQTALADLVRLQLGGFNTSFENVAFNQSTRYGLRVVDGATNLYLYNCTGTSCDDSWLWMNLASGGNLTNLGIFGAQIDNCGTAPIHIEDSSTGDTNVVFIHGLETESLSSGLHDQVIRVDSIAGSGSLHMIVAEVSAHRDDGDGDAVCKRTFDSVGANPRWSLTSVHGNGYNLAYHDAANGVASGGLTPNHVHHGLFTDGLRGFAIGEADLLSGTGTPEGTIPAKVGSVFNRTDVAFPYYKRLDAPIAAQGTLTMDTIPADGNTVTVDYKIYTFQTSLTDVDGNINIGGTLAQAKLNFVAAFDLSGTAGTDYATSMQGHNTVDIAAFISDDAILTARLAGTGGNSIVTTETFTPSSNIFDAATLGTTTTGTVGDTGWRPYALDVQEESANPVNLVWTHSIVNMARSGAATVNLPDNATFSGKSYLIRRDGTGVITIDRAGSDTFDDGDIAKTLDSDGAAIGIFSIGDTEWKIVGTEGTVGGS